MFFFVFEARGRSPAPWIKFRFGMVGNWWTRCNFLLILSRYFCTYFCPEHLSYLLEKYIPRHSKLKLQQEYPWKITLSERAASFVYWRKKDFCHFLTVHRGFQKIILTDRILDSYPQVKVAYPSARAAKMLFDFSRNFWAAISAQSSTEVKHI